MSVVRIVCDGGTRKTIGIVKGDMLVCPRDEKKHLFRCGRSTIEQAREEGVSAWGLDCKVCDGLLERGIEWLVISTKKTAYRCKLRAMQSGFVLSIHPHRAQYFLYEQYFEEVENGLLL